MRYIYIHPIDGIKAYDAEVSLSVLQKLVDGRITILPLSASSDYTITAYANEEGVIRKMMRNPYVLSFLQKIGADLYYTDVYGPVVIIGTNEDGEDVDLPLDIYNLAK
jgi:hypothetical protein